MKHPYTIISATQSLDGYLDDSSPKRLLLSSASHFEYVDQLRSKVDAILVGAETIRRDNCSLLVRNQELIAERLNLKQSEQPIKITLSTSGTLDPEANFFKVGNSRKIIFCPLAKKEELEAKFTNKSIEIIALNSDKILLSDFLEKCTALGISKLLVEGGSEILTQFISQGLFQELHLGIASFFLGSIGSASTVKKVDFFNNNANQLELTSVQNLEGTALLVYKNNFRHVQTKRELLIKSIELSKNCTAVKTAYSVGAIITDKNYNILTTGYSRETDETIHAEEVAIYKAREKNIDLRNCIIFSSMEPCSQRKSKPKSCTDLIIESNIKEVVFALKEPKNFVNCEGKERLKVSGVKVYEFSDLGKEVLLVNQHLY